MGEDYHAEVTLRYVLDTGRYRLIIEGRADGVIDRRPTSEFSLELLSVMANEVTPPSISVIEGIEEPIVIDEIKGTYRKLRFLREPLPIHLAQAKCYAYLYGTIRKVDFIRIRMTYCHLITEEIRYFHLDFAMTELYDWFQGLIQEYLKWADFAYEWKKVSHTSIAQLAFPFPYRSGQKELVTHVYQTIYHKKKLFLEAPTGVGKTISTIFPAVKAVEKEMGSKIFYLTAKTITRTVAAQSFALLRQGGLRWKSIVITAKDKICFLQEAKCNPDECPYAKGHYNRINACVYDVLTDSDDFSREKVEEYARRYMVCPYELSLDLSLFADGIICDYNYLFDPHVYLRRFFEEPQGDYLFLVDEAHNLLSRGREMFSATLVKERFQEISLTLLDLNEAKSLKANGRPAIFLTKGYSYRLLHNIEKCNQEFLTLKRRCKEYQIVTNFKSIVECLLAIGSILEQYWDEGEETPITEMLLTFYYEVNHFIDIYDLALEQKKAALSTYVMYTQMQEDSDFIIRLLCMNPSENLRNSLAKGRSSILFSATLLPIQYYKELLGGDPTDYEVYAKSVFDPDKKALLIASDVTSRYARRTESEYRTIAGYIHEIVKNRHGNYIVFAPSYQFLRIISEYYREEYGREDVFYIQQEKTMDEGERELFLSAFESSQERTMVAFCVLGGIFGEGIDLKNDRLIGAMIIGTGIAQVTLEKELLRRYFDEQGKNGFDYAYRYPGMNKVLQAAGRVIRTMQDVGIVVLLDERFLRYEYQRLFPLEWEDYQVVTKDTIAKKIEHFWDSWL
jgi:Rad3-related DNA helicase